MKGSQGKVMYWVKLSCARSDKCKIRLVYTAIVTKNSKPKKKVFFCCFFYFIFFLALAFSMWICERSLPKMFSHAKKMFLDIDMATRHFFLVSFIVYHVNLWEITHRNNFSCKENVSWYRETKEVSSPQDFISCHKTFFLAVWKKFLRQENKLSH